MSKNLSYWKDENTGFSRPVWKTSGKMFVAKWASLVEGINRILEEFGNRKLILIVNGTSGTFLSR